MRIRAFVWAVLILPFSACDCGDDPGGGGDDAGQLLSDGAPVDQDGNFIDGDGNVIEPDGGGNTVDGAPVDEDGNFIDGDGNVIMTDGGNPLEQPLSEFCRGEGTVVTVGAGGECAGELAEETFQFALCACETIEVQSNLEIDAFDSRNGPYGGANVLNDGHLGLNMGLDMDGMLIVRGGAFVGGGGFSVGSSSEIVSNLYADGDAAQENSSTSIGRNAFINGNVSGRYDIAGDLHVPSTATVSDATETRVQGQILREMIPSVSPCPCEQADLLDITALTEFGRTHNDNLARAGTSSTAFTLTSTAYENGGPGTLRLPCGRYYLTDIEQSAGLNIIAEGRTVLFVDGDMNIGGPFALELEPGAEVDLFIKGSLTVGSSARFGSREAPSKVRTYVGGSETILLSASAIFGGNLYAPNAVVHFDASSTLYGSVFARRAIFDGSANIHFDSAIRSAGDACEEPMPGTDGGPVDPDGAIRDGADPDPPGDGGPVNNDGGPIDNDGGPIGNDGGPIGNDSGVPDPVGCDGCNQCGDLACIIPPNQMSGMCAPCTSDLDCCAPDVCVAGFCMISI